MKRVGSASTTGRAARRAPRARINARRHPRHAPVWLFDLDNTLHHASHAIFPLMNQAMTAYVARTLAVETARADQLRADYTRRYGATLRGLLLQHRVDPHAFLREVHAFDDLPSLVRSERGLATLLRALPGRRIVLTNGPQQYAHEVLKALGIGRLFERVIAIEQMRRGRDWRAKPHVAMLRDVLQRLHAAPADTILVEDTRSHLKQYRRLGLKTVWMVGHLPSPSAARTVGFFSRPVQTTSAGRPPYVDFRVRSLHALRALPVRRAGSARP